MSVDVIILAGGLGTRLSYKTIKTPKALVRFSGVPNLVSTLNRIAEIAPRSITLSINASHHQFFNEALGLVSASLRRKIRFSSETLRIGTGGAIISNLDWCSEDVLIVLGDIYTEINFKHYLGYFISTQAAFMPAICRTSHPYDSDLLRIAFGGRIEAVYRDSIAAHGIAMAGLFLFKRDFLKKFADENICIKDLTEDIIKRIRFSEVCCIGYYTNQLAIDFGTKSRRRSLVAFKIRDKRHVIILSNSAHVSLQGATSGTYRSRLREYDKNLLLVQWNELRRIPFSYLQQDLCTSRELIFKEIDVPARSWSYIDQILIIHNNITEVSDRPFNRFFPISFIVKSDLNNILLSFVKE